MYITYCEDSLPMNIHLSLISYTQFCWAIYYVTIFINTSTLLLHPHYYYIHIIIILKSHVNSSYHCMQINFYVLITVALIIPWGVAARAVCVCLYSSCNCSTVAMCRSFYRLLATLDFNSWIDNFLEVWLVLLTVKAVVESFVAPSVRQNFLFSLWVSLALKR